MGLVVDGAGLLLGGGSAVVVDGVGVAVVVTVGAALAVLVCVVLGVTVVLEVVDGVGLELVDDLAMAVVLLVLGLADVDAVEDADELGELVVAVAVCTEDEGSALAVGSLVDGCGLGELLGVAVGVGVAVGEEVDCGSGWHCCTAPVDVANAASSTG